MFKRSLILKATGVLAMLLFAATCIALSISSPTKKLTRFHEGLVDRYPIVVHITSEDLAHLSEHSVILFDVRDPEEFSVSHLKNAIHVSPEITADKFLQQYSHQLSSKLAVFYCSVGERSSKLAEAIVSMDDKPHFNVVNLEGGLFKWHNERRPVVNLNGLTNNIHPFNNFWGRLLIHKEYISIE